MLEDRTGDDLWQAFEEAMRKVRAVKRSIEDDISVAQALDRVLAQEDLSQQLLRGIDWFAASEIAVELLSKLSETPSPQAEEGAPPRQVEALSGIAVGCFGG